MVGADGSVVSSVVLVLVNEVFSLVPPVVSNLVSADV